VGNRLGNTSAENSRKINCQEEKLLASDDAPGDRFGVSVAVSGGTAVVGAYEDAVGATLHQGSAYIFPLRADLSLTKTDAPDPVPVGAVLTYTIDVRNNGPASAGALTVTDLLPKGVHLRSASSDHGVCARTPPRTVECDLGEFASDESATVTIRVRPIRGGTIVNTATVAAGAPLDPDPTNNTATTTTLVTR
jgi:large repetitive protein